MSLSLGELIDLREKFQESYDCEKCLRQVEYYAAVAKKDTLLHRIMCRHCIEYEDISLGPYCKNCIELLPKILATNVMITHCKREKVEFYNVDKSTFEYKILKDHLPEKDAEVDSFFYSIIPKERLPIDPLTLDAMTRF